MQRLVLFDIDETLVHSDGVGRRAIEAALRQVFNPDIDASGHIMSGKTDPQICHELLLAAGYSQEEIAPKLPTVFNTYIELLEREISRAGAFRLHKGVMALLDRLQQEEWCYLGLLTGNIELGARLKLTPFDLNPFFAFGAFGCDSADRNNLPSIAHVRARDVFKRDFAVDEIVIIGDAVNDVLCAKGYGVKSIITCTGHTPKAKLVELKPDYLFDSLADTEQVLQAIRN